MLHCFYHYFRKNVRKLMGIFGHLFINFKKIISWYYGCCCLWLRETMFFPVCLHMMLKRLHSLWEVQQNFSGQYCIIKELLWIHPTAPSLRSASRTVFYPLSCYGQPFSTSVLVCNRFGRYLLFFMNLLVGTLMVTPVWLFGSWF